MLLVDGSKTQNMAHVNVSDVSTTSHPVARPGESVAARVPAPISAYLQQVATEEPCTMIRVKYSTVTFTAPELHAYRNQAFYFDQNIDYDYVKKPVRRGAKGLYINIEARHPVTNQVVGVCLPTNHDQKMCHKQRNKTLTGDHHAEFRNKFLHLSYEDQKRVQDNTITLKLRTTCAAMHHGLDNTAGYFVFLVEIVDETGAVRFKTVFRAHVHNNVKGGLDVVCPPIPLFAVA